MFEFLKSIALILKPVLGPVWLVIKNWWWFPLPFILWKPFSFLWLWWRSDKFAKEVKPVLLEIKIPKEIVKPIRAMESVMNSLWQILYDPPDWWEKWIEGKILLSYSFEIVSIGGNTHFFIRVPKANQEPVEAAIYSQYPEVEISVVDDYTQYVPKDIPNKEWDLWGADYKFAKPNPYPIRTYLDFETERESVEEKRVDPLAVLLESMAKIKPGEQFWIQIIAGPITDKEIPWTEEGKKIKDELARRTKGTPPPQKPIILEAADVLITGEPPKSPEAKKEEILPPEMKLTPGEREILSAIERKITKRGFKTSIRFIYLGKKEVFFKPKLRLALGFFSDFCTQHLNSLFPHGQPYITKIKKSWFLPLNLLINRRLYLRKRSIFRKYKIRVNPKFPGKASWPSSFVLNTEELASLFHFPGYGSAPAPSLKRIETKKGEPPANLPIDE